MKRIAEADEKEEGLSELIKECDDLFSKFIRLKYADKNGQVKCYTCDKKSRWQEMQCGHYISRANMFLRFDERNARVQDSYCNCTRHGNLLVFAKNLDEERHGITDILYEESKIVYRFSREELKLLSVDLKRKIKILVSEKNIN